MSALNGASAPDSHPIPGPKDEPELVRLLREAGCISGPHAMERLFTLWVLNAQRSAPAGSAVGLTIDHIKKCLHLFLGGFDTLTVSIHDDGVAFHVVTDAQARSQVVSAMQTEGAEVLLTPGSEGESEVLRALREKVNAGAATGPGMNPPVGSEPLGEGSHGPASSNDAGPVESPGPGPDQSDLEGYPPTAKGNSDE